MTKSEEQRKKEIEKKTERESYWVGI